MNRLHEARAKVMRVYVNFDNKTSHTPVSTDPKFTKAYNAAMRALGDLHLLITQAK